MLQQSISLAIKNEEKYKLKPIRRIVLVHEDPELILQQEDIILSLKDAVKLQDAKIFYLKQQFSQFMTKYPFLCLSEEDLSKYHEETKEVSLEQAKVLYAYSQFPQELLEGQLYLGSKINSNSLKQLNDLGIKTLIDLTYQEEDVKISDWKLNQFKYITQPVPTDLQVLVEFQAINEVIDLAIQNGKTLVFCQDGNMATNAIGIGYLMYLKGLKVDIASLKVFQMRGNTEVNKQIYSQLMLYVPSKKQIEQQQ